MTKNWTTSAGWKLACAIAAVGCGSPKADARPTAAVATPDAGTDADAGPPACVDEADCKPEAPRLLGPQSTGIVTSQRPTVHFTAAAKADSYEVQLCADAACSNIIEAVPTTTTSATPTKTLPVGAVFWRVLAVHGAFATPSATWEFFVGHGSATKDTSWLGPPDFDRNGRVDVALGSASNAAYVMLNMPPTGLPTALASQTLSGGAPGFGRATANAGDVNGDGFGDLIVGAMDPSGMTGSLLLGGPTGVGTAPELLLLPFGAMEIAVGGAGDVNGDGYADVLVGSDSLTSLYLGGPTGASGTPSGTPLNGGSGSGAGDVNGDGFADVVVCSRFGHVATVYFGGPNGLGNPQVIAAPQGATEFGEVCITAGDVNGDGYADVLVGTTGTTAAYLFYGSPTGVVTANAPVLVAGTGGSFGPMTSIASAGDVNGDGYADVVIGAYNSNKVLVYHGGANGVSTVAATTFNALAAGEYAVSVASVGDTDGDGFADIAFAPAQCMGFPVLVYPGSASGVKTDNPIRTWDEPPGVQCLGPIAR